MVRLNTNVPAYENDVKEVIRMFLGLVEIEETMEQPTFSISVRLSEGKAIASEGERAHTVLLESVDENDRWERKRVEKRAIKRAVYALMQELHPTEMPWGSLTGIRPTKLYRELAEREGEERAKRRFSEEFSVRSDKQALIETLHRVQSPVIRSVQEKDIDLYLGIPYCRSRCLYCSFGAEVARGGNALEEYLNALFLDMENGAALVRDGGFTVRATYFGGGTPTVLDAKQLDRVLTKLTDCFSGFGQEFTVEAGRPDTITAEKLRVLKAHGVERISINPQTMSDETLKRIGRFHTSKEILDTFALARSIGFSAINMDIIAGLPGETEEDMAHTLSEIERMRPDNLTVHTLAIKRSSRLKERLEEYPLPSRESVERMIRMGAESAERMGMVPYYLYRQKYQNGNLENVGYATPETVCMYNIDMMEETTSILAQGAGAMNKRVFWQENRVERIANPKDVPTYREKLPRLNQEKRALFLEDKTGILRENS